jgi:MFS family permease
MSRVARAVLADITPLRHSRDLRLLMAGGMVSRLGSMATAVAVPYQVWTATHSTFAVGLLGLCELIPTVTVALLGGALADALDRRRLAMAANLGMTVTSGLLIVNASLGKPQLWPLYALALLASSGAAINWPTIDAMYPRLVPPEQLTAVSALSGLTGSFAGMLGPAMAGVILAAGGTVATYSFDVATFVFTLACLALMRPMPRAHDAEEFSLRNVLDGLRFLRGRPVLQSTYLIDTMAMVFGMSTALFPAIASARFGGNTRALGLLYAAPFVGSFTISVMSGWTRRVHRHGVGLTIAACGWGASLIAFGLVSTLWASLLALAAAGASDMVSGVYRMSIWNRSIPDSHRGRVAGVSFANVASGPALGDLEAGFVAALFGVPFALVSGGVLCIVGVLAVVAKLPQALRYDDRDPTP